MTTNAIVRLSREKEGDGMGFGETRQLLAATGEFTAVIYTIVEYPSTWKEGTKQPEGVIENTFEMRFREKTRKGIA